MSRSETTDEVTAADLISALEARGFAAEVQQTGGGTATIYATRDGNTFLGGPGAYDFANPGASTFDTGDLYVGPDEEDNPGICVTPGSTAEQIAEVFANAAR